jgi:hypothetical protein
MVKKCANPRCSQPFLHLAQGRVFALRHESRTPIGSNHHGADEHASEWECFWLCDECAATMTIAIDREHVVRVIPIPLNAL